MPSLYDVDGIDGPFNKWMSRLPCHICGASCRTGCDPCGRPVCKDCSAIKPSPICLDARVCDRCGDAKAAYYGGR